MLLDIYYRAGRSDVDLPVEKIGTTALSTEYVDIPSVLYSQSKGKRSEIKYDS
jgi:hypothetical protein